MNLSYYPLPRKQFPENKYIVIDFKLLLLSLAMTSNETQYTPFVKTLLPLRLCYCDSSCNMMQEKNEFRAIKTIPIMKLARNTSQAVAHV